MWQAKVINKYLIYIRRNLQIIKTHRPNAWIMNDSDQVLCLTQSL